MVECIKSGEFMHVYNTLVVLQEILPVFPLASVSTTSGFFLSAPIKELVETEKRGDIKIIAQM
jgi:THO complex subunit 2